MASDYPGLGRLTYSPIERRAYVLLGLRKWAAAVADCTVVLRVNKDHELYVKCDANLGNVLHG